MNDVVFETARIEDLEARILRHTLYNERPLSGRANDPVKVVDQITFEVDLQESQAFVQRARRDFDSPLFLQSKTYGPLRTTIQEATQFGTPVRIRVQPDEELKG